MSNTNQVDNLIDLIKLSNATKTLAVEGRLSKTQRNTVIDMFPNDSNKGGKTFLALEGMNLAIKGKFKSLAGVLKSPEIAGSKLGSSLEEIVKNDHMLHGPVHTAYTRMAASAEDLDIKIGSQRVNPTSLGRAGLIAIDTRGNNAKFKDGMGVAIQQFIMTNELRSRLVKAYKKLDGMLKIELTNPLDPAMTSNMYIADQYQYELLSKALLKVFKQAEADELVISTGILSTRVNKENLVELSLSGERGGGYNGRVGVLNADTVNTYTTGVIATIAGYGKITKQLSNINDNVNSVDRLFTKVHKQGAVFNNGVGKVLYRYEYLMNTYKTLNAITHAVCIDNLKDARDLLVSTSLSKNELVHIS